MSIQPYQQRVIDEKRELDEKLAKLREFNNGALYLPLSYEERGRLTMQLIHMSAYSNILGERIAEFNKQVKA